MHFRGINYNSNQYGIGHYNLVKPVKDIPFRPLLSAQPRCRGIPRESALERRSCQFCLVHKMGVPQKVYFLISASLWFYVLPSNFAKMTLYYVTLCPDDEGFTFASKNLDFDVLMKSKWSVKGIRSWKNRGTLFSHPAGIMLGHQW